MEFQNTIKKQITILLGQNKVVDRVISLIPKTVKETIGAMKNLHYINKNLYKLLKYGCVVIYFTSVDSK